MRDSVIKQTVKNWLVSVADPAGNYMRRHRHKFPDRGFLPRKRHPKTTVLTAATPPPEMQRRMKERDDRLSALLSEHRSYFERKAADLLANDSTKIATTKGELEAKLVRFWRGQAVVQAELPNGNSMSRLSLARDSTPFITYWLASNVVGMDAQPLIASDD